MWSQRDGCDFKLGKGENEPLMRETLGPISKSLYLVLLYQFTFAQNRPKFDISGALGLKHYIQRFRNDIGGWDQV